MFRRVATAVAVAATVAVVVPATGSAHFEKGDLYVPWADSITQQNEGAFFAGRSAPRKGSSVQVAGPGVSGLALVGNADKDGTVNSDLAFWGDLAYAGNYGGFRIMDISADQPQTVVDHVCNGPQNDVSVYEMGGKRYLFQSIDTPQTAEDCTSADAPIDPVTLTRVGFEGVRVFDVTNPASPQFIDMIQTACGSHTHTVIPDGKKAYIYVSSYPLGSGVTAPGADVTPYGPEFRRCESPHKKISIIEVSSKKGEFEYERKEQALSDDTVPNRGFQACHDVQIWEKKHVALGSCAGDAQLWDIHDPWNPGIDDPKKHTHIQSPSASDQFEFIHSGVVTWDGDYFAIMDETGGGVTANCFGDATVNGFYYFYKMVKPGKPAPALESRYSIPRDQAAEVCVSHNASVIPVKNRYVMSTAYYQGGVTLVDFTDVSNPHEVAFADTEDSTGSSDEWSSYWYNGRIYSNSGLNRRGATGNRGLDVWKADSSLGLLKAKRWFRSNPQTQESWQAP